MYFKNLFQQPYQHRWLKKFDFDQDPYIYFIENPQHECVARRLRSGRKVYRCHLCKQRAREKMCFVCSHCHVPICKSCHMAKPLVENMTKCMICWQKYYNLQRSPLFCRLIDERYPNLTDFLQLIDQTSLASSTTLSVCTDKSDDDYSKLLAYFDWYCSAEHKKTVLTRVWNANFSTMKCWLIVNFLNVPHFFYNLCTRRSLLYNI